MNSGLLDSHVHLADSRLTGHWAAIRASYDAIGLTKAVVVGTSPSDWPHILEIAQSDDRFLPAVGLHPWKVNDAPESWKQNFTALIDSGISVIGEIGLDQWIKGFQLDSQIDAFEFQFSLAAEKNLPSSIHCLKAHQPLLKILGSAAIPERGFKLHAYNGPPTTVHQLLDLGAYFSFNAGQIKPNSSRILDIIKTVPSDRILVETDAPDFFPKHERKALSLGEKLHINHPANLVLGYQSIAEIRGESQYTFRASVSENFMRYFN